MGDGRNYEGELYAIAQRDSLLVDTGSSGIGYNQYAFQESNGALAGLASALDDMATLLGSVEKTASDASGEFVDAFIEQCGSARRVAATNSDAVADGNTAVVGADSAMEVAKGKYDELPPVRYWTIESAATVPWFMPPPPSVPTYRNVAMRVPPGPMGPGVPKDPNLVPVQWDVTVRMRAAKSAIDTLQSSLDDATALTNRAYGELKVVEIRRDPVGDDGGDSGDPGLGGSTGRGGGNSRIPAGSVPGGTPEVEGPGSPGEQVPPWQGTLPDDSPEPGGPPSDPPAPTPPDIPGPFDWWPHPSPEPPPWNPGHPGGPGEPDPPPYTEDDPGNEYPGGVPPWDPGHSDGGTEGLGSYGSGWGRPGYGSEYGLGSGSGGFGAAGYGAGVAGGAGAALAARSAFSGSGSYGAMPSGGVAPGVAPGGGAPNSGTMGMPMGGGQGGKQESKKRKNGGYIAVVIEESPNPFLAPDRHPAMRAGNDRQNFQLPDIEDPEDQW